MTSSARAAWKAAGGARKKARPPAPATAVGIVFHVEPRALSAEDVAAYEDSFLSSLWPQPLRYLVTQAIPGRPFPRPAGTISLGERSQVLREVLIHPDLWQVSLATSKATVGGYAQLSVCTRPSIDSEDLRTYGRRPLDLSAPGESDGWVKGMLELADRVGAYHGVVPVMSDPGVLIDISGVNVIADGVPQHPAPAQLERMVSVDRELVTRYVRFPRWGTLLSHAHVQAIGGRARIEDAVHPAVVEEVGRGFYFQLTTTLATAMAQDAQRQQLAFTELAAPLLPPTRSART